MRKNFLCLNDEKTEFLVVGSKSMLTKLSPIALKIGDVEITPTESVRNIGFLFDKTMSLDTQIASVCKSSWYQIRRIGQIRSYLDPSSTECLIHAFITSRLDFNNSLYYGLPDSQIQKLQRIQNAAARLVIRAPKHSHITPILEQLHWLPLKFRIQFKILLFTYKAIHGTAPLYIQDMVKLKTKSARSMRSNDQYFLVTPKVRTVSWGQRSFHHASAFLWNQLPSDIRLSNDFIHFKTLLKTFMFKCAFNV